MQVAYGSRVPGRRGESQLEGVFLRSLPLVPGPFQQHVE